MTMSVANTITSSTTYNGNETIIPVSGNNITVTIDSDQVVKGRILIFKLLGEIAFLNNINDNYIPNHLEK